MREPELLVVDDEVRALLALVQHPDFDKLVRLHREGFGDPSWAAFVSGRVYHGPTLESACRAALDAEKGAPQ